MTPSVRGALDARAAILMTLFCLAFGLQQVAIKAIAMDIAPLAQIGIRSAIAAVLVGAVARYRGVRLIVPGRLASGALIGLGFTLEFAFVALGLRYTLASHMAVFLYTAPIFAAAGLHLFVAEERLAPRHGFGIAIAFAGMAIALAQQPLVGTDPWRLLGDGFGVLAGLAWATTTLVVRTGALSESSPLQTLFYQLTTASTLLLSGAFAAGELGAMHMSTLAWASMTFQTLIVSFGALLLWFWLLRRYLASRIGILSLLSPVFGVFFGAVLLGEPLTIRFLVGAAAILFGVVLVSR